MIISCSAVCFPSFILALFLLQSLCSLKNDFLRFPCQVNKLLSWVFISNGTNKEEGLQWSILILHLEFHQLEDDSNGWSIFTFLSMMKLFEHTCNIYSFLCWELYTHSNQSIRCQILLIWFLHHVISSNWNKDDDLICILNISFLYRRCFHFPGIL